MVDALAGALAPVVPYGADVLVVFGVLVMTVGVYGVVRLPDTYLRLHAASKMVLLGVMPLLLASALAGGFDVVARVALIAFFLILTTPVSSHMIGRAAYLRAEQMRAPDPVDESVGYPGGPSGAGS